ncbi:MAG: hypothetical protein EXQ54_07550 [Acidobacteria bacterium]|nr:hypothetical protein [Acidobacteriota bacterium]
MGSDQGRFRVMNEAATGTARVLSAGFAPLVSAAKIGAPAETADGPARSMAEAFSLTDFVTLVRDRVRQQERRR